MNNVMTINGYQAVLVLDPEISMFRGEFLGLNGGADFHVGDVEGLRRERGIALPELGGVMAIQQQLAEIERRLTSYEPVGVSIMT